MNANSSESARPLNLGRLKYTPHVNHAELRPSLSVLLGMVLGFGAFALLAGYITLFVIAMSFDTLFGLNLLGGPRDQVPPPSLFGVVMLLISLLPGLFCLFFGGLALYYLRFWRYPTVFNYKADILQRGGKETCRLSEISEIRLSRTTDPDYPGKARIGLLVVLRDGSVLSLDPPSLSLPFLRPVTPKESFTALGVLHDGRQMESARRAASDIASRIGVSVNESTSIEPGSLAPAPPKGGM